MNLRNLFLAAGIAAVAVPVSAQKAPEPYGLTPVHARWSGTTVR